MSRIRPQLARRPHDDDVEQPVVQFRVRGDHHAGAEKPAIRHRHQRHARLDRLAVIDRDPHILEPVADELDHGAPEEQRLGRTRPLRLSALTAR